MLLCPGSSSTGIPVAPWVWRTVGQFRALILQKVAFLERPNNPVVLYELLKIFITIQDSKTLYSPSSMQMNL